MKEYTHGRIFFGLSVLAILLIAAFFVAVSLISSTGYNQRVYAQNSERIKDVFEANKKEPFTIIIDPGHGGEDPGAVVGSLDEKSINLEISLKLRDFAALSGYEVVMTRTEDKMLCTDADAGRKKFRDLYNRLEFTVKTPMSLLVSIHQNKFPLESCKGTQVFFGTLNNSSSVLAEHIQSAVKHIQPDNHRMIKPGNNIYLLENAAVPAVIVECGFISNPAEAKLLNDSDYTDKLAFFIYSGIMSYLEDVKIEG